MYSIYLKIVLAPYLAILNLYYFPRLAKQATDLTEIRKKQNLD